jgi:hypothetical protein
VSYWIERKVKELYKKWGRCWDKNGINYWIKEYEKFGEKIVETNFERAFKELCKKYGVNVNGSRDKKNIKKCITLYYQKEKGLCKGGEYILNTPYCKYDKD